MKAIVLHEYGGPDKLKYEDAPDPVAGEGEVLVRLSATSVNPVDFKMRSGAAASRFPIEFPGILGRDIAGIVRAVGTGVSGFAPGDKVIALGSKSYAELAVVKATDLAHLPDGMDIVKAAALPLVMLTGEQLISRGTKIQRGQTVLVTGAVGSVGRTAVFVAKKAGAVVIAGVRKSQLDEAAKLGAQEVLALDDDAAMARLGFIDAVADTVNHATAEMLIGKVKQGRRRTQRCIRRCGLNRLCVCPTRRCYGCWRRMSRLDAWRFPSAACCRSKRRATHRQPPRRVLTARFCCLPDQATGGGRYRGRGLRLADGPTAAPRRGRTYPRPPGRERQNVQGLRRWRRLAVPIH
jgi:Zn-dependent alcohol dehydrogenase